MWRWPVFEALSASQVDALTLQHTAASTFSFELAFGSRDDYIKRNLQYAMRHHRGNKRIKKKRAKRALSFAWAFVHFTRPISRRWNYSDIARELMQVQPLPDATTLAYYTTSNDDK